MVSAKKPFEAKEAGVKFADVFLARSTLLATTSRALARVFNWLWVISNNELIVVYLKLFPCFQQHHSLFFFFCVSEGLVCAFINTPTKKINVMA